MEIETVKIKSQVSEGNPHGYIVINKSDLTDEHTLFEEVQATSTDNEVKQDEAVEASTTSTEEVQATSKRKTKS